MPGGNKHNEEQNKGKQESNNAIFGKWVGLGKASLIRRIKDLKKQIITHH